VASIHLADELVILLIFVNNEHFANTVTVGKVSHRAKMGTRTLRGQGFGAKAIIRVYENEFNGRHFEH